MLLERPRRLALGGPDNLGGGGTVRRMCSEDRPHHDPAHLRHKRARSVSFWRRGSEQLRRGATAAF